MVSAHEAPVTVSTVAVVVDVGKNVAALAATTDSGQRLLPPTEVAITAPAVADVIERIRRAVPGPRVAVRVGIEAAGHYHLPMLAAPWPADWQLLELNPAQVAEQRRVNGKRRVKTDAIDLQAMTDLVLAGRGNPVTGAPPPAVAQLQAQAALRARRVQARTAVMNQVLAQLDRAFPSLSIVLDDVLGAKVGRLIAADFSDPRRLATLGVERFVRYAAHRDVQVKRPLATRLVQAARDALPAPGADTARSVLPADLALLALHDEQVAAAEAAMAAAIPATVFAPLISVPGWATVRVGNYGAAVGNPARWPSHAQLYRAAGLSPAQYESAHKRRDGSISREGSVTLRRALIDLGMGLWNADPAARAHAHALHERGKPGGIIACAMAARANKIAYAMVRDQSPYDPTRWSQPRTD